MLKPFSLIFYKGNSLISLLIKKLTKGKYSHTAMVIDDLHAIQLNWNTPLSISHLSYSIKNYDMYEFTFELTDAQKESIIKFMKQNLNSSYDWKFIFSRFFNLLFNTPLINSKHHYNCDELIVEAIYHATGVKLVGGDIKLSPTTLSQSEYLRKINN